MQTVHITSYLTISLYVLSLVLLSLSPRIMQTPLSFPFMLCYLGLRHLLKLDIFLTSERQKSETRLHEGAAIWILGKQQKWDKIQHWECLTGRQTLMSLKVCSDWISCFWSLRMDWKVAVWKIELVCFFFFVFCCFVICIPGKPESPQWSPVFIHSIAEYWALHSVYWDVTAWLATFL